MKLDPESWSTLSGLLDRWLEQPEEHRARWLEGLGTEHESLLPVLRQLTDTQSAIDNANFLNTLPRIGGTEKLAADCTAQPGPA